MGKIVRDLPQAQKRNSYPTQGFITKEKTLLVY